MIKTLIKFSEFINEARPPEVDILTCDNCRAEFAFSRVAIEKQQGLHIITIYPYFVDRLCIYCPLCGAKNTAPTPKAG